MSVAAGKTLGGLSAFDARAEIENRFSRHGRSVVIVIAVSQSLQAFTVSPMANGDRSISCIHNANQEASVERLCILFFINRTRIC